MKNKIEKFRFVKAMEGASQSFFATTYVLFLSSFGLNTLQINMINFVYMLVNTIVDPVTGFLGDKFGHVKIYKLGFVFYIFAEFIYFFSGSVGGFLIAESFAALSYAFKSEALESWLRNDIGEESFDKVKSKVKSMMKFSGLITAVIGSILASYLGLKYPWLAGGLFSIVTLLYLIFYFKEEYFHKETQIPEKEKISFRKSFKDFWKIKELRIYIVIAFVANACFQPFNMFWTLIFVSRGADQLLLGAMWIGIALSLMAGYEIIHRIQNRSNFMMGIVLILLGIAILISALSQSLILTAGFFFLHEILRPILDELSDTLRNRSIKPQLRSTYNSMIGSIKTLGACVGLMISGWIGLYISESQVWLIFVLPLVFAGVIVSLKGGFLSNQ